MSNSPLTADVPPAVSAQAARDSLGALLDARGGANPITNGLWALGAGAAMFAVLIALAASGIKFPEAARVLVFIPLFAGAAGAVIVGVRSLFGGSSAYYLYERGLIFTHRGSPRTVTWTEVREVKPHRGRGVLEGQLLGYLVVPTTGKNILVGADGDSDTFVSQMIEAARRAGRPVLT